MARILRFAANAVLCFGIFLWLIFAKTCTPLLTVAAVLVHEVGHMLALRVIGCPLGGFSFQAGGLLLSGKKGYSSYADEAITAFAGPFFNLLSTLAFLSAKGHEGVYFRQVSLALAILNLLPISGFDGGRILWCLASSVLPYGRSEKLCEVFSFLALFTLWCASVYLLIKTGRSLTLFAFSAMIFIRILRGEGSCQISEIIRE